MYPTKIPKLGASKDHKNPLQKPILNTLAVFARIPIMGGEGGSRNLILETLMGGTSR